MNEIEEGYNLLIAHHKEHHAEETTLRAQVAELREALKEARKVISLADATYSTMPAAAYAFGDDRPVREALHSWLEKQNAALLERK